MSHHPDDVAAGYCGACHDWTSPPLLAGSSASGLWQLHDSTLDHEQLAAELRPTLAQVLGAMARAFGPAVLDDAPAALVARCRWCGEELQRGVAEEAAQWRTKPGGRYFCPHSADSLHHHGPELDERAVFAACHCLCSALHPAAPGICLAAEARAHLLIAGRRVPACRPCADAALGDPAEEVPSGR